jgi:hypothetical protein
MATCFRVVPASGAGNGSAAARRVRVGSHAVGLRVDSQTGICALLRSQTGAGQCLLSPTFWASWLKYVEMNLESNGPAGTQPSYFGAASAIGASADAIHSE